MRLSHPCSVMHVAFPPCLVSRFKDDEVHTWTPANRADVYENHA
jgi:hypothetical protein